MNNVLKKQAVETWVEMGKPILTLNLVKDIREKTGLGLADIKRAILDSKEFEDMKKNQPKIDMSQCPVQKAIKIFDPDDNLLVETNDYITYLWVRTQIRKNKLYGYYIEFEDMKIMIGPDGTEAYFPEGMMDLACMLLLELV